MGKKFSTAAEVAKLAKLSPATVSRALNHPDMVSNATLERIEKTIQDNNLTIRNAAPKKPVKSEAQKGSILIYIRDYGNLFYLTLIEGLENSLMFRGYHLLYFRTDLDKSENQAYLLAEAKEKHLKGLIVCDPVSPEFLEEIAKELPVIQCCECSSRQYPFVGIDDRQATSSALEHLYSLGCRNIFMINGPLTYHYSRNRMDAFFDFLKEREIYHSEDQIVVLPTVNYQMAYAAAMRLMTLENKPDAIFCASDAFALAAVRAAASLGVSIPEQIAVTGFDDLSLFTQMSEPTLTSVRQPLFQIGYSCGELFFEMIQNSRRNSDKPARQLILNTELIIRHSSMRMSMQNDSRGADT